MCKIIARLVVIFGSIAYLLFLFIGWIEWNQNPTIRGSFLHEIKFIAGALFGAGLLPLVIGVVYLFSVNSLRSLIVGCGIVAAFIVIHYISLVWMAHGSPLGYLTAEVGELILAAWLLYRRYRGDTGRRERM